jgi:hypothetical protein
MTMTNNPQVKLFESVQVRSHWSEVEEKWYFSVVDVVHLLSESTNATDYLKKLRKRDPELNLYLGTNCPQVAMKNKDGNYWQTHGVEGSDEFALLTNIIHQEWAGVSVKQHKVLKTLKTQNLRDHMSEAELIFTALAELSTRQIAETEQAKGLQENAKAGKEGGRVAKRAKDDLEKRTGQKVVTGSNFLPPVAETKKLDLKSVKKGKAS